MHLQIATGEPTRLRWTALRYMSLVESGVISEDTRFELLDGEVLEIMPQGNRHFQTFRMLQQALAALGGYSRGLVSTPTIRISDFTVVDPELAFIVQERTDHLPTADETHWIIEISDTSLGYDLGIKCQLYSESGIPRYWVVDIPNQCIHEFTSPSPDGYASHQEYRKSISIPEFGAEIEVDRLFPLDAR